MRKSESPREWNSQRIAEDSFDPDSIAHSGPNLPDSWRKTESPAFPVGNLRRKCPMAEKSSGRLWKNYTNRIVNLTASRDGETTGCNHGSTIVVEPMRKVRLFCCHWGRRWQPAATRHPRGRCHRDSAASSRALLRNLAQRLEHGRASKMEDPPFPVLTLTTHGDHDVDGRSRPHWISGGPPRRGPCSWPGSRQRSCSLQTSWKDRRFLSRRGSIRRFS